jgi:hypothetical protein
VSTCPKGGSGKACSGDSNGACNALSKTCLCKPGFSGSDCGTARTCPKGRLVGESGFWVEDAAAGIECSGRGSCVATALQLATGEQTQRHTCHCNAGFAGRLCQDRETACPLHDGEECGGPDAGKCHALTGKCFCLGERSGTSCGAQPLVVPCPSDCNDRGECRFYPRRSYNATSATFSFDKIGYCKCAQGSWGKACEESLKACPATALGVCNGEVAGRCNSYTGACSCAPAFEGAACDIAEAEVPCPSASGAVCSGHGACNEDATCLCRRPYAGLACDQQVQQCPTSRRTVRGKAALVECGGNGWCKREAAGMTATCVCRTGYAGAACDTKKACATACRNGGQCNPFTGECMCRYGFSGDACALVCPANGKGMICSGRGTCGDTGVCSCLFGFTGADCSVAPCPANPRTGEACSGSSQGGCAYSALTGRPKCRCAAGFSGYACEISDAALAMRRRELRTEVSAAIKAAGEAEQERAVCLDGDRPYLCPDDAEAVASGKRGTCQASRKDCGSASARQACKSAGKRWCGVSCIEMVLRCPHTRACKVGRVRCADGSCASRADKCADASSLCDVAGEVPCGDGVTCAASARACRQAVQLGGCPVGEVACASNPKECRADKKDCHCGAVVGEQFCGWQRNDVGRLMRRETLDAASGGMALRKQAKCAVSCGGGGLNPLAAELKPLSAAVHPLKGASASLEALDTGEEGLGSGNNHRRFTIGAIRIPKGVVVAADDSEAAVAFAIKPVAQADVDGGSFGRLERMSAAISMVADRVVTIDPDVGIEFDLCIGDDDAQTNATKCAVVLARLRPMSSQDISASESDAQEVFGGCRKGTSCGCSCAFTTPHLTSFIVTDPGIELAGEVSVDQIDAGMAFLVAEGGGGDGGGSPTAPPTAVAPVAGSGGGGGSDGLPLGAIVGAGVAVAVAGATIAMKKQGKQSEEPSCDPDPEAVAAGGTTPDGGDGNGEKELSMATTRAWV